MTETPLAPKDPRPDDVPYYIDSGCENCDEELIYYHEKYTDEEEPYWYDEFVCPNCRGVYLDVPDGMLPGPAGE